MKADDVLTWRVARQETGVRLLQFLREKCPEAPSVKALKRAIDNKLCTVNHRIETFSSFILKENDIVVLSEDAFEKKRGVLSVKIPILYEDEELLIVNKPVGLVSDGRSIKRYFPHAEIVHRLDKETTGVLILAKTVVTKKKMTDLFKERAVRKLYLAVVDGVIAKDSGRIDNFLGKKHSYQGQTIYGSVGEKKGERAITDWKCLTKGKTASIVSCEPYTGRTHQLRVHLSGMGHPILGDVQYGKKFICPWQPQRNLLHAYCVVFKHPSTGKELKVIAPIPADFRQAFKELKVYLNDASCRVS
ncbi:MAG: RluA family pseudouridine synthase [Rhabdochlamydiaceae bacterium]